MMSDVAKKTVLAFDTAMGGISVGVIAANGHVVSRQLETQREQASLLIPMIQDVLSEAQIGFKDLDLITSTMGPGSFTGLRIGLTTAKVLSQSLDIPLVGLNTLSVMARHYEGDKPLLIVLETKRQDFYAQYFDGSDKGRVALSEPFSALASEVIEARPCDDFEIGGDCLKRFQSEVSKDSKGLKILDNWMHPDAIIMAQMALTQIEQGSILDSIEPVYLRGADVSMPKIPPRQLAQS